MEVISPPTRLLQCRTLLTNRMPEQRTITTMNEPFLLEQPSWSFGRRPSFKTLSSRMSLLVLCVMAAAVIDNSSQ